MTDQERMDKFNRDFAKLRHNREEIPLEQLQTRYARAYHALLAELEQDADWWAKRYIRLAAYPRHPGDRDGNAESKRRITAILREESKPGGRVGRYRAAITQEMDREKFERIVWEISDRLEREVYRPYWQRHCFRQEDGRWYNDIIKRFWAQHPNGERGRGWWGTSSNERFALMPAPEEKEGAT